MSLLTTFQDVLNGLPIGTKIVISIYPGRYIITAITDNKIIATCESTVSSLFQSDLHRSYVECLKLFKRYQVKRHCGHHVCDLKCDCETKNDIEIIDTKDMSIYFQIRKAKLTEINKLNVIAALLNKGDNG